MSLEGAKGYLAIGEAVECIFKLFIPKFSEYRRVGAGRCSTAERSGRLVPSDSYEGGLHSPIIGPVDPMRCRVSRLCRLGNEPK